MRTINSGIGAVIRRTHEMVWVVLLELTHEPGVLDRAGRQAGLLRSVESIEQPGEYGIGRRDGRGTMEGRVIFILSAAGSHRMVLRVEEKPDLLGRLLWTQP